MYNYMFACKCMYGRFQRQKNSLVAQRHFCIAGMIQQLKINKFDTCICSHTYISMYVYTMCMYCGHFST